MVFAAFLVKQRDGDGPGEHRYHAGFLDYAKHCGFVIKLCRPYRARTKGKVERFNGYLRRSFYVPLVSRLKQAGLHLDVVTANAEVRRWQKEVANECLHGTTGSRPVDRLPGADCPNCEKYADRLQTIGLLSWAEPPWAVNCQTAELQSVAVAHVLGSQWPFRPRSTHTQFRGDRQLVGQNCH